MKNEALDPNVNELLEKIGLADKEGNTIIAEALRQCLRWYRTGYHYGRNCAWMEMDKIEAREEQDSIERHADFLFEAHKDELALNSLPNG